MPNFKGQNTMGLHICLMDKDSTDHEDWDYIRQGNDRIFPDLIDYDDIIEPPKPDNYFEYSSTNMFRPKDTNKIRNKINTDKRIEYKERYLYLMDLIDDNPDYYLYFSY